LKQVVDELDSINFRKMGPDVGGYFLVHADPFGRSALNGQFRTPQQIRAFMVAMVDQTWGYNCDLACGLQILD